MYVYIKDYKSIIFIHIYYIINKNKKVTTMNDSKCQPLYILFLRKCISTKECIPNALKLFIRICNRKWSQV